MNWGNLKSSQYLQHSEEPDFINKKVSFEANARVLHVPASCSQL